MILSIIVAVGKDNEIGRKNGMLWHLPAELKRFKELTISHPIIMGRKTFESLPKGPLPNRTNIIITRNEEYSHEGCLVFSSIDAALIKLRDEEEIFIIGGGQMYEQTLPIADKLYLTRVHASFSEADTFFPEINASEWREVGRETFPADEKNPFSFTFYEYEKV